MVRSLLDAHGSGRELLLELTVFVVAAVGHHLRMDCGPCTAGTMTPDLHQRAHTVRG